MNHKMAEEWIKASSLDLKNIKYIIEDEYLTTVVAFHSQQAIEKLFKACFEFIEVKYPKQHDLINLSNLLKKNDINLKLNNILLKKINDLYTDSRYPSEFGLLPDGQPSLEEAKEFYEFALNIYEQVKNLLEKKTNN